MNNTVMPSSTSLLSNETWIGASAPIFTHVMNKRTLPNTIPYLVPILASLPKAFTFLDVGCGPGSLAVDVAVRFPQARILALDVLPATVESARQAAREAGVADRMGFEVGSALDLERHEGAFDVVHTHQVLVHTMDAGRAMEQLRRAARGRGGLVCCCENDFEAGMMWPEDEVLMAYERERMRVISARGTDPLVGRKLVMHALAAGFQRQHIQVGVTNKLFVTQEERDEWAALCTYPLPQGSGPLAMEGQVVERAQKALDSWRRCEGGLRILASPWVVCRRQD